MTIGADDYAAGANAGRRDFEGLPRVDYWPALAREALHGLPGRIVDAIAPYTEADPVATLINVLAGVGNLIGSGPHARVQHDVHPCRLYAALVGRTSKGRKGLGWSTPRHLLTQVDERWARDRVKPGGLSSGEGLIHHVRDARLEKRPIKDHGRTVDYEDVLIDEGVTDKRLLIVEPEFAVTLKAIAREGNTLSGIIRQSWDTGDLANLVKNSPLRATGAHISILGHITVEEICRHLTETERANGFANRFLWLLVRRSKVLPEGAAVPDGSVGPLVTELREVVAFARGAGEIRRDDETRAIWREVYPRLSEGEPGMIGAILARAEAQVLRLSVLYAIFDRSPVIRPAHLEASLALWDYAEASARRIFGDRLGMPVADLILETLRAKGPMTETQISGLFGRHKSADEIAHALRHLESLGKVRRRQIETGGRPATVWETTA
jgi:hypothetical protein